jgi:hypothetical protein
MAVQSWQGDYGIPCGPDRVEQFVVELAGSILFTIQTGSSSGLCFATSRAGRAPKVPPAAVGPSAAGPNRSEGSRMSEECYTWVLSRA